MSWRIFTHHALKTILRTVQVAVLVIVPAVLLWLQFAGLPKFFYPPVIEAAAREGLNLGFERMRLSLIEGLVLDRVSLRAENLPANNEVAVDRAAVSLDWRALLRREIRINALDLRGAQLYLPVEASNDLRRTMRLTQARARLMVADGVVSVPLARFNLQGIDVIASGQIAIGPAEPGAGAPALPPELGRALEILETLDFGPIAPVLQIEFRAVAGQPENLVLSRINFVATRADYRAVKLADARLEASYEGQTLELRSFTGSDESGGTFNASGRWNLRTGDLRADIEARLDPAAWWKEIVPETAGPPPEFASNPLIRATITGTGGEEPQRQAVGTIVADAFTWRDVPARSLAADFAWRNGELYVSKAALSLDSGTLQADLMMRPGDVRLRVDSRANPLELAALLGERERAGIAKMNVIFTDPPHISFEATGTELSPDRLTARGKLQLGRTSIHDSPMDGATADLLFENLSLTLSGIEVQRPEGRGSGSFTYDFGQRQVRLDNVRSTMTPFNVLQWADPKVAKETLPYRFKAPPDVTVNGVVQLDDPARTELRAAFKAPQGFDYDLLDKTLNFGATTGTLDFRGREIRVNIPSAALYRGTAKISAVIKTGQPNARQQVEVDLDAVDFETLTRLYFGYKDSQGRVSGSYDFTFVPGQPREMRGRGRLLVEDGNVFAIPVLGPLSAVLNTIIPGAGYQTAREATCDFRVADGEIRTDNLDVKGQGFSMIGEGSLFFVRDAMDFAVRINAQGVPGLLLYPVSKLMEYVSDGKLSDPQWRPRILPKVGGEKKEPARDSGRNP